MITKKELGLIITDCKLDTCDIKEWIIKPMRRKFKAKIDNVLGIRHKDLGEYTLRGKQSIIGYMTALYPSSNQLSMTNSNKPYKKISTRSYQLLWRFDKIY